MSKKKSFRTTHVQNKRNQEESFIRLMDEINNKKTKQKKTMKA